MEMNATVKRLFMAVVLAVLPVSDLLPTGGVPVGFVDEAAAIVGVPLSPLSFAGVARRTTRRRLVAASAASAAAASSAAAGSTYTTSSPPPQPAPSAPPPSAQPAGAPPVGTIVTALPSGCVTSPKGGVQYYDCGGVYYRPAFQSNNLVYVVQNP
jgi:hypothetical protein